MHNLRRGRGEKAGSVTSITKPEGKNLGKREMFLFSKFLPQLDGC